MLKDHWSKNKDIVILKVALPAKLLLKLLVNLATVTIAYLDIKFIKCLLSRLWKKKIASGTVKSSIVGHCSQ